MCLTIENLQMRYWPEYNTYVGTGYKRYNGGFTPEARYLDTWLVASGLNSIIKCEDEHTLSFQNGLPRSLDRENNYPLGFHILLNQADAQNYATYHRYSIYKVDYTDVIGFGQQLLYKTRTETNCVIARYMYIHSTPVLQVE